jgi:hypothetical protein
LGGNEEFESASIEVKTASSGWVELIVDGKLGKNNAVKTADGLKARAAAPHIPFFPLNFGTFGTFGSDGRVRRSTSRLRIFATHSLPFLFDRPAPQAHRRSRH